MGANTLSIGVSGLNTAQMNINITGQNISNASTPGYTRQQAIQRAATPMYTGAGFLGQGVDVTTVKRVYSDYLNAQVLGAQAGMSEMDHYGTQISQVVNLMSDSNAGLSPAMASFFSALDQLAANPSSIPSRQAFLSESQSLVDRFQSMDARLQEIRNGVNTQISDEVSLINSYAQQIADANQRILVAQAAGADQAPNDLLDRRDQLISDLNKEIRATVLPQSDGSYSVVVGTGQPLVVGTNASRLVAIPDNYDAQKTVVALQMPTGGSIELPDNLLKGGSLGGLLAFRNESLDPVTNSLGRAAIVLAQNFNDQHKLGMDLGGQYGLDYFKVQAPEVMANQNNALPNPQIDVAISDTTALTTSDYKLVSNGNGNYTLTRMTDGAVLVNNTALPATIDGLSITLSSVALNGSSFIIRPTRPGARDMSVSVTDPRNIGVAVPIRTGLGNTNTGVASIDGGSITTTTPLPPQAPITLRYFSTPTPSLDGFPVGSLVDNGHGQLIRIDSPTTRVPYAFGDNLSFSGIAVTLTGAPLDGDAFTIDPSPASPPPWSVNTNTGLTSMFGVPALPTFQGAAQGTAAPTYPLLVSSGINDQFNISIDGGPVLTKTMALGFYPTAQALAKGIETAIGGGVTVTADASGKMLVTSNTQGGASAVAITPTLIPFFNAGFNSMFGGAVTTGPRGVEQGGAALASPTTIKAGINDEFSINVDGAGLQTVIIPAGNYTPADLAYEVQSAINNKFPVPGVEVKLNGSIQLVVTSNQLGGGSAIALTNALPGLGSMTSVGATVTQKAALTASPITLTYDQATNTLSGFPSGSMVSVAGATGSPFAIDSPQTRVPYVSNAAINFNGMQFTIKGVPNNRDTFIVGPNTTGVADNRNALLLGALQTKKILDGGTTSLQGTYASMVNQVGNKAREVQVSGYTQQALAKQSQGARDSVSAVNLDEEAANLLRYQQAYQASARLISVAGKLFDTLLQI